MNPGELFLAQFPFGDAPGMKLRPVLLLAGPFGSAQEFVVAYISSVVPADLLPSDLLVDPASAEHASANLKTVSLVRLHKLATIHSRGIKRRLGMLSAVTLAQCQGKLRELLGL